MALELTATKTITEHRMEEGCTGLLIAVSGGPDSMALLHFCALRKPDFPLYAAHVHHGLRPESDEEEQLVIRFCQTLGVPCSTLHADIHRERQKGETTESAARRIRYDFFQKTAKELHVSHLATAHTADDQAETVLLHLIHGSGAKGLSGIAPVRQENGLTVIRPLINCPKSDTIDYCKRFSIPHALDASNNDPVYTRNRIRNEVLPLLRQMNPKITQTVCRTADVLREQQQFLEQRAETFLQTNRKNETVPLDALRRLSPAERSAVLRRMFFLLGKELSAEQTEIIRKLLDKNSGSIEIDRKYTACVSKNTFSVILPHAPLTPVPLREGETVLSDGRRLSLIRTQATEQNRFELIRVTPELTARPRQEGDVLRRNEHSGRKTVKRAMIDANIPRPDRDRLWIICDKTALMWVECLGVDRDACPKPGEPGYKIVIEDFYDKKH